MSSRQFSEATNAIPPTSFEELDVTLARLASRKDAWPWVGISKRIEYLQMCADGIMTVADRWVQDGCKLKGIPSGHVLEGEEWVVGPAAVVRNLRLLVAALEAGGAPRIPKLRSRADGQLVARVFPANLYDRLVFPGFNADVWLEPGKPATQGEIYRNPAKPGRICLVLGAGNVSSIAAMDTLYKLFAEDEVVILKMNPVNAHIGPKLEEAFRSLIEDGYLAIVYGGVPVGGYLANHVKVDTLHVTGSEKTYDAIVWGSSPEEQQRRKAAKDPINTRPFTAELGCVTPCLIVPGPWSKADLDFQARQVASMVAQNASFNCNAAKVLVLAKGWPLRDVFLGRVHHHLAEAPPRKAYYPGAHDRYRGFLEAYPQAKPLGATGEGVIPWTLIPDVAPKKGEYALTHEAFCGVIAEVSMDMSDPAVFLDEAAGFANEACRGTLSCCVFIHPLTERTHRPAFDAAIAKLRYGAIGVNCWPAVAYGLVVTPWGAFPGHPPEDIQSGAGFVHNTSLLDHIQKTVVRAPFRIFPTPLWFMDNRNLADIGRKLTRFEYEPGPGRLFDLALAAAKG